MGYRKWNLQAAIRRQTTERARTWLTEFLDTACSDRNIQAIVVVGSAARPGRDIDDLDLIVLCQDRAKFNYKAPIDVDLRAFVLARVDHELSRGHDLLGWAVKFGRPVFDRDETWSKLVSDWKDRISLPDPEMSRQRAQKIQARLAEVCDMGDSEAASELELSYLTQIARANLSEAGIYPRSRPELPQQLREIGMATTAETLERALARRLELRAAPQQAV